MARIGVIGLGYVGAVSAACYCHLGHEVKGVEISASKRDMVRSGVAPVTEPSLDKLIEHSTKSERLTIADSILDSVLDTEISVVCVNALTRENGSQDHTALSSTLKEIGAALREAVNRHVVVIRTTLLPGTSRALATSVLEKESGKHLNEGFGLVHHPEFLREGNAVQDFLGPSRIVTGTDLEADGRSVAQLYEGIESSVFVTTLELAEMLKYADNAFHALKIDFANELGVICEASALPHRELMDMVVADNRLNLSAAYLRPGAPFGGSCLAKDLRALTGFTRNKRLRLPVIDAVLESNSVHMERILDSVFGTKGSSFGVVGLAFKSGTDDVRDSPTLLIARVLIEQGKNVQIYDPLVDPSKLLGQNKLHFTACVPNMESHIVESLPEILANNQVIIIAPTIKDTDEILRTARRDQYVVDLTAEGDASLCRGTYIGPFETS